MKLKINLPEVITIFNEIQKRPKKLFAMMRAEIRDSVGKYLTEFMNTKMTHFLDRAPYERIDSFFC